MKDIEIRKVSPGEIDRLQQIGRETFSETFYPVNSKEDMEEYLAKSFKREKLEAEMADINSEFYFAISENKVIGYLKINLGKSQTEIKDDKAMEIERIYVLKEFQGEKAGQKLYEKAMEISRQRNVDYIWLGVWEKNFRALGFYKKNGFEEFDRHIFKLGDKEQTDLMMRIKVRR